MKILLTTLNAKYIHINLAIRLLYELNRHDKDIDYKEFAIKEDKDEVADFCKGYDIIAFSCYIWNITQTLEVARRIKALNPACKILLGGPEVSYDWQNVIANEHIDFIITGEGEIPFREFLESFPEVGLVSNLVRKENGIPIHNVKAVSFDVNNYKDIRPYQNDTAEELFNKVCYIETSRGCPYKCEFCLASLDNKVRYLPMEHIKANLLYLMQNGRVIKFLDRTFNVKKDFTLEMFQFILDHHRPGNIFQFEITADILHPDIVKFIHEKVPKGLFRFEIGIQTVNQKANLEVKRKQNFERTKSIILSLSGKIEMHLDLIVGLPLDYWDDIRYSFEEVFKLYPPELQLGFLKFLKGTPVRERYDQYGFEFDPEPPYQIIRSNYLSSEELHRIELVEEALETYWNKKRAVHTLKFVTAKYGIFDFLLGLAQHFIKKKDFHQYGLSDVFEILFDYAEINYPQDEILKQLITIDYYLSFKVKPKTLFVAELDKEEKNKVLDELQLDVNKFRYVVLPLNFDFGIFKSQNTIIPADSNLTIRYTGTSVPEIIIPTQEKILS